jgi:hypothetical protein
LKSPTVIERMSRGCILAIASSVHTPIVWAKRVGLAYRPSVCPR